VPRVGHGGDGGQDLDASLREELLDFLQASSILRAAEPAKADIKEKLAALLSG
jgi:hypothetical protein